MFVLCAIDMVHDDVCMYECFICISTTTEKQNKNPVIRGDNSNERHKSIENDESR